MRLQRTRPSCSGCNHGVLRVGLLSLGRYDSRSSTQSNRLYHGIRCDVAGVRFCHGYSAHYDIIRGMEWKNLDEGSADPRFWGVLYCARRGTGVFRAETVVSVVAANSQLHEDLLRSYSLYPTGNTYIRSTQRSSFWLLAGGCSRRIFDGFLAFGAPEHQILVPKAVPCIRQPSWR